MGEEVIAQ